MRQRRLFFIGTGLLFALGILLAWWRTQATGVSFWPGERHTVWLVEARVDFMAQGGPVTVNLDIPDRPPGFVIYREEATSPGYGFSFVTREGDRRGEWTIRYAKGMQTLYYKGEFVAGYHEYAGPSKTPEVPSLLSWKGARETAARQVLEEAKKHSSTPESLVREIIREVGRRDNQNASLLLSLDEGPEVVHRLLAMGGIPSHLSLGLWLEDARRNQQLTPFIEVFVEGRWKLYDLKKGELEMPQPLLLWHQSGPSLLDVVGGNDSQVHFSMIRQSIPARELTTLQQSKGLFNLFSVHQLPVEEQSMFKMMLLLPIGALVVVIMRILVGIRTSGTFMPVLIAVAFLQTALLPGLVSFISIVLIGLMLRSYLSGLNLLMVSRISAIIVIVIFIIGALSLVGYHLGFNTGMTVTFFPIIIIAWTIERMSILWEEEGSMEVMVQGGGSLLVAVLAYLFMDWSFASHLTFNFPEINLSVIALILFLGQYTGYKLSELYRFRAMEQL